MESDMGQDVVFREMALGDAGEVAEFCFVDSPVEERPGRVVEEIEEMARGEGVAMVAEAGDQVVGMGKIALAGEHAWLHNMNVREGFRGRGIGQELTRRLAGAARDKGARRLFAHVRADNEPARGAYEKAGMRCWSVDGMRGAQLRYGMELE